jgi:hypothetical protein
MDLERVDGVNIPTCIQLPLSNIAGSEERLRPSTPSRGCCLAEELGAGQGLKLFHSRVPSPRPTPHPAPDAVTSADNFLPIDIPPCHRGQLKTGPRSPLQ